MIDEVLLVELLFVEIVFLNVIFHQIYLQINMIFLYHIYHLNYLLPKYYVNLYSSQLSCIIIMELYKICLHYTCFM